MLELKCECGNKADVKEGYQNLCHKCYFKLKGVNYEQWSRGNVPRTSSHYPGKSDRLGDGSDKGIKSYRRHM